MITLIPMQVLLSKEETEKQFYESLFVVSHSTKTISTYKSAINHLRNFLTIQYGYDEIHLVSKVKSDEMEIYGIIRQFIIFLDKKGIRAKGIVSYLSGVKGYLRFLGIRINSDDFKQLVKIPKIVKTREIPLTKEMILQLLSNASPKLRTSILVACSSGLRIGELVQLRLEDIDFESKPTKITIRGNTSKGRMSRETFLTSEATNALKDYLKRYFDWKEGEENEAIQQKYIFWRISKGKTPRGKTPVFNVENAKVSLQRSLEHHIKKIPELNKRNENGLRAIHFHVCRKFFRTTVGNVCGRDFAEALMGHSFYMDTYYQLPEEKKCELYLQAESHLTISDTKIIETNFKSLAEKYDTLETKVDDLLEYLRTNSIDVPHYLR